jgi:SAM-dependent methyltransferase
MTIDWSFDGGARSSSAYRTDSLRSDSMFSPAQPSLRALAAKHCSAYDAFGRTYTATRTTDPRIADVIHGALGDARSVLNVGAGTGSYEPHDRQVLAVEPSETMLRQRPRSAAPVVRAQAEALPLSDQTIDASMALMTLHHWEDWRQGVHEMRRVTRDRIVVWTFDPDAIASFWLVRDYFPEILEIERERCPSLAEQVGELGAEVLPLPIPRDCKDGVLACFWARPEAYLHSAVRAGISLFYVLDGALVREGLRRLAEDLRTGAWNERNGELETRAELDVGYRVLIV